MSSSNRSSKESSGRKPGGRSTVHLGTRPWIELGIEDVGEAREVFLSLIPKHAPGVIQGLMPVFGCRTPHGFDTAILDWARKYHLTHKAKVPDWVTAQVRTTVQLWKDDKHRKWRGKDWVFLEGYEHCETGIEPERLERAAALARIPRYAKLMRLVHEPGATQAQADLKYRNAMRPLAKALSLRPRPSPMQLEHFVWAVRFQCGGERIDAIASEKARSDQAVSRAVSIVLNRVGLTRRRDRVSHPS